MIIVATADGKLDPDPKIAKDQAGAIAKLTAAVKAKDAKLLLHLHGGLVDDAAGRELAARLAGPAPRGWELSDEWTQLYVVWRTGAFETFAKNWHELAHNDRLYRIVLRKLMEFVAGKLGVPTADGRGATPIALTAAEIDRGLNGLGDRRAPFAALDVEIEVATPEGRGPVLPTQGDGELALEFQDFLAADAEFNGAAEDIDAYVNAAAEGRAPLSAGNLAKGQAAYERLDPHKVRGPIEAIKPGVGGRTGPVGVAAFLLKHGGKIAFRCFRRFRTRRDHGFHATLVEEVARELYGDFIGATIWGFIVDDAGDHFELDGFGAQLLELIPKDNPVRIVVTAHSAGAIWATHLLKSIAASGRPITVDLVLLAPAVRTDLFGEMLATAEPHIDRCRMLTMSDALERRDAVLGHDKGYIYPSSLLYLVSGLFEEAKAEAFVDAPLLGMQRFVGAGWLNDADQTSAVKRVAAFFQAADHDIVYAPTPSITLADTHGGFDSEPVTLASVRSFFP